MTPTLLAITPRSEVPPIRGFSSSRLYATALYSENEPSTETPPPGMRASANDTILVRCPSAAALEEVDEPIEPSEIRFRISPRAAEQLRSISRRDNDPSVALRVAVDSGGCHGYQYKMNLTYLSEGEGDYHFLSPMIAPSNVLIDPVSLGLLNGATLDFATELIGSSFRVIDNPLADSGCGCGVSWEAKV
ncbi:uncharacterized protein EI90DRAFT_3048396 [Cantharellus anzutake]|uniref:uncharacterized protein n=1 Tax=Cantharellus anzutake TaxID=1750568 RepID=UPI0019087A18|nr:uncharacterized protein EI90DRAFT_3048396 [Cantharellus anzutake]KAF8335447.1 hypothetical protein EI90DRAFT_3048396 [Cantharellus anzutake]